MIVTMHVGEKLLYFSDLAELQNSKIIVFQFQLIITVWNRMEY